MRVNGYAYRGLSAFARLMAEVEPGSAARYSDDARRYREDIRRAAMRSMASAPVAQV